jgi:L-2,4-diaminobutyrate decarboxylase
MDFVESVRLVAEELERYGGESASGVPPVVRQLPLEEIVMELDLKRRIERGGLGGEALAEFIRRYLSLTVRLHHPGSLAHQVAAPHPSAAWAGLVEGFTNNPMNIYEMGPAAAAIEAFLIGWLIGKAGYASGAGGVLTHGGSLANLTALIAARGWFDRTLWAEGSRGDLALVASAGSHYSVARAAGIMGIGEEHVYEGETVAELGAAIARARAAGRRPFALVANACSTATGVFDPLGEIAALCREHNLWFHVDGAHGASALLSPRHRARLDGVELADSLTWDAHKLMRTPGLCTALLARDARTLDGAFHEEASYLFHDKPQPGFDFIHRTVECTKASLGFRLFVVLAAMGEEGLAAYIDRQFEITQQAYEVFRATPGIECPVAPQSNILCFRVPGGDDAQLAVRDRLLADGGFHLSTAVVGGRRHLRIVVTSPETGLDDLRRLAGRAAEVARETGE